MKEKNWIFFRITVYVWLAAAIGFLALLGYASVVRSYGLQELGIYIMIAIGLLCVQILFNMLNVRLIHHYFFNKILPQKTFQVWHTVLLILNGCIGILLMLALSEFIREYFTKTGYRRNNSGDVLTILILSTYLFVILVTIICSIRLRKFIKRQVALQETNWLNELGTV